MVVVVVEGTNSASSDFVVRMTAVVHIEAATGSNTMQVGTTRDDTMLAWVHPDPTPHSSSSMCLSSFTSRAGMLCNLSLHVLLTYRIYKRGLFGYLLLFANINTPRRDFL